MDYHEADAQSFLGVLQRKNPMEKVKEEDISKFRIEPLISDYYFARSNNIEVVLCRKELWKYTLSAMANTAG